MMPIKKVPETATKAGVSKAPWMLSKSAKCWLLADGIWAASVGNVTLDDRFLLRDVEGSGLALVSRRGEPPPTFAEALFYARCLSFDHECPVVVVGRGIGRFGPRPWLSTKSFEPEWAQVQELLSEIQRRRSGGGVALFRRPQRLSEFEYFNLPLSARYGQVADMLAMYATALLQVEPLGEYLHYYRVVERAARLESGNPSNNGKDWVERHLQKLATFSFGELWLQKSGAGQVAHRSLFQLLQRRAVEAFHRLGKNAADTSKYLYGALRCGIAHSSGPKTFDFGGDVKEVGQALPIVKLLARIAIENLSPARRPVQEDGSPFRHAFRRRRQRTRPSQQSKPF